MAAVSGKRVALFTGFAWGVTLTLAWVGPGGWYRWVITSAGAIVLALRWLRP